MAETPPPTDRPSRPAHWAHPVDESGRRRRARRARRWRVLVLAGVLLVGALFGLYTYLTSDERVEKFAETYLENLLGTRVSLGRASFSLTEGLVLEDLVVLAPPPFREPILTAETVHLRVDPVSLLRAAPAVTEIAVQRPRITLVLWNEETWNFQSLIRSRPAEARAPRLRPVVALEGGTLRIVRKTGGQTVYEHRMQVSGLLLPSEADRHTFRFQTDLRSPEVHLSVASGLLDARTGRLQLEGHASNVQLTEPLYRSLPKEVQAVWDRFNPTGTVNAKLLFDEQEGFRLAAELTGVSFSYTYQGQVHRFANLTGRCTFAPGRLDLAGVQGLVNGWPVRLDGRVWGFGGPRLGLDLAVVAEEVDLAKSRPLLVSLAPHVEALYRAYAPEGRADLRLRLRREARPEAALRVSGDLVCRGMTMTYRLFPYRVKNLEGTVHFSPDGYTTEGVVGRHGEAVVRLQGRALRPGPNVQADVTVTAENVALDEDLRAALPERQRRIYDLYAPTGRADLQAHIVQPGTGGRRRDVTVHIRLRDAGFTYAHFPYPLEGATGEVVIAPDRAEILGVEGRHGRAVIRLAGRLEGGLDREAALTLQVTGRDVALDEDLRAALPERQRRTLEAFHLSGLADFEGTVTRGPRTDGRLDYDLAIRLRGARMIYEGFPLLAEQVTGEVRLRPDACRIDALTGFNRGARIEATGWIEQRPDDYAMDLVVTGTDVVLDESLRGALGPAVRSAWSHLAPRGRVDVRAHLEKAFGPKAPIKHHVWVTMKGAQARLDVFPYPLEHVTGQMEFAGEEVWLHEVSARSGLARLTLGGRIGYANGGPSLDLRIRAEGLRFEGPLREALPAPLARAFDRLRPTGRIDLDLARLRYRVGPDGRGRADWYGTAVLDEVGVEPGLPIRGAVGTAEMLGRWEPGRLRFEGEVRLQQAKVAGKEVHDLRLRFRKPPEADAVALERLEGRFYGGRLEGTGTVGLADRTGYALRVAVAEVDLERLLREGFRLAHNIQGGRLRGTLGLRAVPGRTEASGFLEVHDARLYELPLVVRLINVFRLASGERTAFREARVLYFLKDRRLYLGDIRLRGQALALYGAGVMEPDGRLHLTFLTGQPDENPLLPALSELAEGLRKQLVLVLVTGTLAEPVVEFRTLSAITDPLREVLRLLREEEGR